jgi:hypothetical protein
MMGFWVTRSQEELPKPILPRAAGRIGTSDYIACTRSTARHGRSVVASPISAP